MITRIKIVPLDSPNAEGEWLKLPEPIEPPQSGLWSDTDSAVREWVPDGYTVVAVLGDVIDKEMCVYRMTEVR